MIAGQVGVSVKTRVPVQPWVSVAVIVKPATAVEVGVPLMTPAVSVSPAGSVPVVTAKV